MTGEFSRWSLWAAIRRVKGWFGAPIWKVARFPEALTKMRPPWLARNDPRARPSFAVADR